MTPAGVAPSASRMRVVFAPPHPASRNLPERPQARRVRKAHLRAKQKVYSRPSRLASLRNLVPLGLLPILKGEGGTLELPNYLFAYAAYKAV